MRDLVAASLVNHSIRDTIEKSPKLQTKLCLRPAEPDHFLFLPFECTDRPFVPGFSCGPDGSHYRGGSQLIRASFDLLEGRKLPGITPLARRMLVCQPPVIIMEAYAQCCGSAWPVSWQAVWPSAEIHHGERKSNISLDPGSTIRSTNPTAGGLTIGHLYDCAKHVIERHRYCALADYEEMDENGFVDAGLYFFATVRLNEGDPMLESRACRRRDWVLPGEAHDDSSSGQLPIIVVGERADSTAETDANETRDRRKLLRSYAKVKRKGE